MEINSKESMNFYSGNVKIKLYKGKKLYDTIETHNTGTVDFFSYMLRCITGDATTAVNKRPAYLVALNGDEEITYPILYEETPTISTTGSSASETFSFFVPYIAFTQNQATGFNIYSFDKNTIYATVAFDPIEISQNTNTQITWTVSIANDIPEV